MKPSTSRKKLFEAKKCKKKSLLHVHVSKELKARMKTKRRSVLVKKGDRVRIMRGSLKGKEGKVMKVNYGKAVVFVEGLTARNAKGKESMRPFQPSNLLLTDADMSGSRKELFEQSKVLKEPVRARAEPKQEEKQENAQPGAQQGGR